MSKTVTVPLTRPIEAHGETLSELTLSEIDLGALEDINLVIDHSGKLHLNLGDLHRLIAGMANIPPSSARKILIKDVFAAREAMEDFLGISLPIGES